MRSARNAIAPTIRRAVSSCLQGERRKVHLEARTSTSLSAALCAAAEIRGEPWQAVEAVRLLALTGCRAGEIANLKQIECDLRGAALRLSNSKTGASVRPIGKAALEVLSAALSRSSGSYVLRPRVSAERPTGGFRRRGRAFGRRSPTSRS